MRAKLPRIFFYFLGLIYANSCFSQEFDWAKSAARTINADQGFMSDTGNAVVVDAVGNVYVAGTFSGTSDFNPGLETSSETSAGEDDMFISKFSSTGTLIWSKQMGGPGEDRIESIAFDVSGNLVLTGFFEATVDFDPGVGTINLTSAGERDIFISKLDSNGNVLWANRIGGSGDNWGYYICTDTTGNIHVTGSFSAIADFDPTSAVYNLTSTGDDDIFIAKYSNDGNLIWAKQIGSLGSDFGSSIAFDASGNSYSTGFYSGNADFDPGAGVFTMNSINSTIFILKLDPNGDFVWSRQITGSGSEFATAIALDAAGNIFTTGFFTDTADFDPGSGTYNLTSSGGMSSFICKFDANGEFEWAKQLNSTIGVTPLSLALDNFGNIYTSGHFYGTTDFNPGTDMYELSVDATNDMFVLKLDPQGNFAWVQQLGGSAAATESARNIFHDKNGSLYVTGSFIGNADFDASSGLFNLTAIDSDAFVYKLSDELLKNENFARSSVILSPNPAAGYTSITGISTDTTIKIFDMTGKIVLQTIVANESLRIDTTEFANGVYIVQLENQGKFNTLKLLVNK